jgi:hypothetical protein
VVTEAQTTETRDIQEKGNYLFSVQQADKQERRMEFASGPLGSDEFIRRFLTDLRVLLNDDYNNSGLFLKPRTYLGNKHYISQGDTIMYRQGCKNLEEIKLSPSTQNIS